MSAAKDVNRYYSIHVDGGDVPFVGLSTCPTCGAAVLIDQSGAALKHAEWHKRDAPSAEGEGR